MNFLGDELSHIPLPYLEKEVIRFSLKKGDVIHPAPGNREFPGAGWTKRFNKWKNATYNPNQTR
ncbi:hypothetical protein [Ammoniphilus sp. 3BR4]|uniref:hypothetical protein n=1 Tax=Ammoniphilus sp. 3BR4 TaxID=3158265 RepID=UPI003466D6B8